MRPSLAERFETKYEPEPISGCWLWLGALSTHGYGKFSIGHGKETIAHRFSYELAVGPIPAGLQIDHLCRVRACVNPQHLEPVTNRVNALRGVSGPAQNARKTQCVRGHVLDEANTYYRKDRLGRHCKQCHEDRRNTGQEPRGPTQTHCKHGHLLDADNTYIYPNGHRGWACRKCALASAIRYLQKRRGAA